MTGPPLGSPKGAGAFAAMLIRQKTQLKDRLSAAVASKAVVERQRDLLRRQLAHLQSTRGCQRLLEEIEEIEERSTLPLDAADVKRALARVIEDHRLELRREDWKYWG